MSLLETKQKEVVKPSSEEKNRKRKLDVRDESCSIRRCDYLELDEFLKSELQCSICRELFIKAIVLNCGHTFCKYCVGLWKKQKNICPICRANIIFESQNRVLDSVIESSLLKMDDSLRLQRLQCILDRENIGGGEGNSLTSHRRRNRRRSRQNPV